MPNIAAIGANGISNVQKSFQEAINNISNAQVNGYKQTQAQFTTAPFSTHIPAINNNTDSNTPLIRSAGNGTQYVGVTRDLSLGTLEPTRNKLDVALLLENSFLAVIVDNAPNNRLLTRSGKFKLNQNREITDLVGRQVSSIDGGTITIPEEITVNQITIDAQGLITGLNEDGAVIDIGQLAIYSIPNPDGLSYRDANSFAENDISGDAEIIDNNESKVQQEFVEKSNVDTVQTMISIMSLQQESEAMTKIIQADNEMHKQVSSILKA
ncbi:MAG: flagellar hook-basal body protein [Rickettsiaceae bacterium]